MVHVAHGVHDFPFFASYHRRMAITPLYTLAELDIEIAQAKLDLAAARQALIRSIDAGGIRRHSQREQVKNLQDHLGWLQQQRAALELSASGAGGGAGAQSHVGRPAR